MSQGTYLVITEELVEVDSAAPARHLSRWAPWAYTALAVLTAIFPVARAFSHTEITYNEGWNVYNAGKLAHHQTLYPAAYGWTTVNYPMLSFAIVAAVHRWTHDYLYTARALSILGTIAVALCAGCIVRRIGGSTRAAWIAAAYLLAVFCVEADAYVGQDDPQMLALAFFMAGLLLYVSRRESLPALAGVAALLVIAGNIKHDPLGFPIAIALDLMLVSWRRMLWFCAWGIAFAFSAMLLTLHFGGPGFLLQLFAPRAFSWLKGWTQLGLIFGPLALPFCIAAYAAIHGLAENRTRVMSLLLVAGLATGILFGSGAGVTVNA